MVGETWLPRGHHWDLHIEHESLPNAGTFTGGGWKLCLHTTESPWDAVDAMYETLRAKNAAAHFVIGGRLGTKHPVAIQMVPLNRAARALQNDQSDGFQTNRANVIQIEVCGRTAEIPDWSVWTYKALSNLTNLIQHRVPIPNRAAVDFSDTHRLTDAEWVAARGYVDHGHCPDNTHRDAFRFREGYFVQLNEDIPDVGWNL